jgi:hypothetical protein
MSITAMSASPDRAMLWAPRLLAVAVSLFLGLFSLDAFSGTAPVEGSPDFVIHLIPAAVVLGIVAVAWHRQWLGAVAFIGLAVAYALTARAHMSWIAMISGPLLMVGALYAWNWTHRARSANVGATR